MKNKLAIILISFTLCLINAAEYDGVWFLGFNCSKPPFNNIATRQTIYGICQTPTLAQKINMPPAISMIYPNQDYSPIEEKTLALSDINQPKIESLTILHTDGYRTKVIFAEIKNILEKNNIQVIDKEIPMSEQWEQYLNAGDYDLFLMGFKSDYNGPLETYLEPLLTTKGYANFMRYSNPAVNSLIEQYKKVAPAEKQNILKQLNKTLYEEVPCMPIFYIEKL